MKQEDTSVINTLKIWIAPSLLTFVGFLIWRDISEMRTDVKALLQQQSANQARIDMLEKQVTDLESKIYVLSKDVNTNPDKIMSQPIYAIKDEHPVGDIKTEKKL